MKKKVMLISVLALCAPLLMGNESGCSNQYDAMMEANNRAADGSFYIPKNDIERKNYNKRQRRADDPTAIIWCTSAFPVPSSPLFTVPVVGKLTSGGKGPFPKRVEQAGPDLMYGSSGDYRYGFTPGDVYADYYGMAVFCTDEPMIWQRESTTIVMQTDPRLAAAQKQAQKALRAGRSGQNDISPEALHKAYELLEKAIQQKGVK